MTDRHQFRAKWLNYNKGVFFVTICTHNKIQYFGKIVNEIMYLSPIGKIAEQCIEEIPNHISGIEIWNKVVMPNHIHLIVSIEGGAIDHASYMDSTISMGCLKHKDHYPIPDQDFHHNSKLAITIGQYKAAVTRRAKAFNPAFKWQKKYHDCFIRTQPTYQNIMNYIDTNVENWMYDCFNQLRNTEDVPPWKRK